MTTGAALDDVDDWDNDWLPDAATWSPEAEPRRWPRRVHHVSIYVITPPELTKAEREERLRQAYVCHVIGSMAEGLCPRCWRQLIDGAALERPDWWRCCGWWRRTPARYGVGPGYEWETDLPPDTFMVRW